MAKNKIEIIYEDEDLIVLNKPAGMLAIPDRYIAEKPNLLDYLKKNRTQVLVVHRLDKGTSGVMVYAKNAEAHRHLSQQFENREVEKIYKVLVAGKIPEKKGIIDKAIAKHLGISGKMVVHRNGKPSLTHYEVEEYIGENTLVLADLKTGRTHQIRVHFEALGFPLYVDEMYGASKAFFLSSLKGKRYNLGKFEEEQALMSRPTLHSWKLSFKHPRTEKRIHFEAELPKDFAALLKQMRKFYARTTM